MKIRTRLKRALALLFAFVMVLPMTALLAEGLSEGEGYTWDESTKTLTLTASTEDYTGSTYSSRPYDEYADQALKVVINGENIHVGDYAFYRFTALTDLEVINAGEIGDSAFKNCLDLETVTIQNCGDIGNYVFGAMLNLTGQGVDESIKTVTIEQCGNIGEYAFGALPVLESVTIGSCESIGEGAFGRCDALTTLEIGSCQSIGETAFNYSTALKEFRVSNCQYIGGQVLNGSGVEVIELTDCVTIDDYAFQNCHSLTDLTLTDCGTLGTYAFGGCENLTNLTITNLDTIGEDSFAIHDAGRVSNLTNLTLKNVRVVSSGAFENCQNLTSVDLDGCEYLGGNAFSGCVNLTNITIPENTRLGYSDVFVNFPEIMARVEAILDGEFALEDAEKIDEIAPEGWTSTQVGENNSASSYDGDTQLTKEAKWNDSEKTVADVQIQVYYTAERQMDFVFVADCSNSMAGIGNSYDMNSKFYDMQSKLLDVTEQLLTTPGYDCRVAFATFGESESGASTFYGAGQLDQAKDYIVNDIFDYKSNTNYSSGLAEALKLVKGNTGRNTTVVFISDGQPFAVGEIPEDYYGREEAAQIKAEGAQIIGVLQSVSDSEEATSVENMQAICDQMFVSKDTAGFSQAVNDAIANAYGSYTLTDVVDPAFELDVNSIQVSAGEVVVGQDENGNTTITWTINGMPFTKHTMTFQEKLKADENGVYPNGSFDTNEGGAILYNGEEQVNLVPTPVLSRGDETPVEPEVPETGDSSSPLFWSAMMVVAGGAVLVLVRKKKAA